MLPQELINKRELSAVNREKKKAEFEKVNKNTKASERDKTTARVSFVEADKDLRKADSVLLEHVQEFERDRIRDMKVRRFDATLCHRLHDALACFRLCSWSMRTPSSPTTASAWR